MDLNRSDLLKGIGAGKVPNFGCLTSESVEGTSLAFQGIDDIHGSDSLPLGMLGVGDGITDDVLKEYLPAMDVVYALKHRGRTLNGFGG